MNDFEKEFQASPLELSFFRTLRKVVAQLRKVTQQKWNRSLPLADYFYDRWERAADLGFGEGTTVYDSCLVFGDVKVGKHTWIGPQTILDGSGGLTIGDYCTLSAGVQIYSHDTVKKTLSAHQVGIEKAATKIGSRVYLGPNVVIAKGVTIGDDVIIGAFSLVLEDVPSGNKAFGQPCRLRGTNP